MTTTTGTSTGLAAPDLTAAAGLVDLADRVIAGALTVLRDERRAGRQPGVRLRPRPRGSAAATARALLDVRRQG